MTDLPAHIATTRILADIATLLEEEDPRVMRVIKALRKVLAHDWKPKPPPKTTKAKIPPHEYDSERGW